MKCLYKIDPLLKHMFHPRRQCKCGNYFSRQRDWC